MKKTFLHLIILCLSGSIAFAQSGTNPESAYKSQDNTGKQEFFSGYKPAPFKLENYKRPAGDKRYKSAAALPAKYDLRDENMVTSAKDQSPGGDAISPAGNCVSFASMGSIESRWLKMGYPEIDLSEQNLAACNGFDEENWGYGQGSNQFVCSAYLTRGDGPITEADDPYDLNSPSCVNGLSPVAYVPDSRFLPVRDFDLLKHTIYNHGAVYVGIHWDVTGNSFRASDNTYRYFGFNEANHAVLVCGWDDAMPTAGGTGAWIVKNSWGTEWADGGFFYISYQDIRFAGDEMAYYPKRWETSDVDTAFIHDELGFTSTYKYPNTSQFFELAKFESSEPLLVTHVGICVADPETVLDFMVYNDFDGTTLSNPIGTLKGVYVEIPGIYTFELPVQVNGDFYIEVKRQTGKNEVNYPVETADEGFSDPVYNPDVNWYRKDETGTWQSTFIESSGTGFNFTIRAFAKRTDAPRALFSANKTEACITSEVVYTYLENNTATSWEWDFGEGADPAAASTVGPHTVTYSTQGTKTVKLIVSSTAGADTTIQHQMVNVGTAIRVNILKSVQEIPFGESMEISAYGADTYTWLPENIVDNPFAQTVVVTPPATGDYTLIVSGTQKLCAGADTILIKSTIKPENDDMCHALLLTPSPTPSSYSNEFASPETGEPAPDEGIPGSGDCYAPMKWCDESGDQVNNSLWFYFYGPESGFATIHTSGMDNQMAIYRADTCISIIKDSLKAANDDVNNLELAAKIDQMEVKAGEKYFVQIDGSAGGEKGTFEMIFSQWPVGQEEIKSTRSENLLVYPNPGSDVFNIHLRDAQSEVVEFFLYNLNGQLIMKKSFRDLSGEVLTRFDVSQQSPGIYHLRIIDGDRILDRKLIKN